MGGFDMSGTASSSRKGALTPGWGGCQGTPAERERVCLSSHALTYLCLFFTTSLTANSIFDRKQDGRCVFWINGLIQGGKKKKKKKIALKESVQISNMNWQYKSLK